MAYWDTSCLVKLYAPEPDSEIFKAYVLGGATVVTSEIARLELWTTLRRKETAAELSPGAARKALREFDSDIASGHVTMAEWSAAVVAEFEGIVEKCHGRTPPLPVRTLDAIHLASAAVAGETVVVATDKRIQEAARILTFTLYPGP